MEVSLKKADQLQKQLLAAAKTIKVSYTVKLSAYSKVDADTYVKNVFEGGLATVERAFHAADSLLTAGFEVRRLVGEANATGHPDGSINDLVNRRALAEAKRQQIQTFLDELDESYEQTTSEELVGSIAQVQTLIANQDMDNLRHAMKVFEGTLVTPSLREGLVGLRNKALHETTEFTDLLAVRNMATFITLPKFVVTTLREQQIIRAV